MASLALLFPAAAMAPQPAAAARSCTGWTSTSRPPNSIRVLARDGNVEKVDFRRYVGRVMASGEWPARLPRTMLEAGAVAVKQFAWYHSLEGNHRRSYVTSGGKCYDVTSTTRDQMYKSGVNVGSKIWNAIDATWGLSVRKGGRFMLTQYNAGSATKCGSDANGKVIRQRSARNCANNGYSARQILRTYYGPSVSFNGSGGGGDKPQSKPKPNEKPKAEPTTKPKASEATSRPKASAKPKADPKPKPKAPQRSAAQAPLQPTPTPQRDVEIVAWWEIALGGRPDQPSVGHKAIRGATAQVGNSMTPSDAPSGGIRVSTRGGEADEFGPLIARTAPGHSDAASAQTTVSFVGRSLRLAAVPGPAGEVVSVFVDGQLMAMIDMHWPTRHEEVVVYEQEWEDEATHSVKLLMLGMAEQLRLELDASQVHY